MKFKFSLEKVLKHRQINMDLARKDYLEALEFWNEEKEKYVQMQEARDQAFVQRAEAVQSGAGWKSHVESINLFIQGQDFRIAQQNERLLKIEKVVESRREILKDKLIEVKIMERLKEKKKADYIEHILETESKELDEISTIRFVRMTKG